MLIGLSQPDIDGLGEGEDVAHQTHLRASLGLVCLVNADRVDPNPVIMVETREGREGVLEVLSNAESSSVAEDM